MSRHGWVLLLVLGGAVPSGVARAEAPGASPPPGAGAPAAASPPGPAVESAALIAFVSRRFSYVDDVYDELREYSVDLVPAPELELGWYPGAHLGSEWGVLGLVGSYQQLQVAESRRADGRRFDTTAYAWSAGLRLRLPAGQHRFLLGVDIGRQVFRVAYGGLGNLPRFPGVDYRTVEPMIGGRLALGAFALSPELGGGIVERVGELRSAGWFPRARAASVHASVRLARPVGAGLEPFVTLEWRRYVLQLNPERGDANVAGGAGDDYLGLGLGLGWQGPPP